MSAERARWARRVRHRPRMLAVVVLSAALVSCSSPRTSSSSASTTTTASTAPPSTSSSTVAPTTSTTPVATTTTTVVISPPNQPATVVRMGSGAQPRVALTFDAGSDGGSTSRILDLLAARGLHATFGLTGQWVLRYPELARRIVAEGHAILNHTQDHRSFTGYSTSSAALTTSARLAELADAAANIKAVTGADPSPWFRPPYGDYDNGVLADVGAAGYRSVVMWSTDSLGWRGIDPAQVVARTLGGAQPGAILLFHVGSASTDADALPAILDGLQARGLAPVTIPELLGVPSGPGH